MEETKTYPPFLVNQRIKANSLYYAGKMGSIFYVNLRDNETIIGVRCPKCNKTFWPPRLSCTKCFSELIEVVEIGPYGTVETFTQVNYAEPVHPREVVEIGPYGTVETFTQVNYAEPVHPRKAPFVYGVIRLDGADSGITHFIDDVDFGEIRIGMRVKPVFAKDKKGNILDIKYFKPI